MEKCAVLAVQGAFAEHEKALSALGCEYIELRQASDMRKSFDRLILPGGESTVMGKLTRELQMFDELKRLITDGMPVFGTCAGLILLAKSVDGGEVHLGTMDISAKRNAYGRQLGSFSAVTKVGDIHDFPMVFIRAPYISELSAPAEILAEWDGRIVAARQKNMLATAFHPELTDDLRIHQMFLDM